MSADEPANDQRLRCWTRIALALGLCLCGGGIAFWFPAAGGQSTAVSDLGLAFVSGGLAITAGAGIAYVVSDAERRFAVRLRRREDAAARANLIMSLTMTDRFLDGVDLGGRDLEGVYLGGTTTPDGCAAQLLRMPTSTEPPFRTSSSQTPA